MKLHKLIKRPNHAESQLEKLDELQTAVQTLKEKHKDGLYSHFSDAQFHCWGSTLQLGNHTSALYGKKTLRSLFFYSVVHSECVEQLVIKWDKLNFG